MSTQLFLNIDIFFSAETASKICTFSEQYLGAVFKMQRRILLRFLSGLAPFQWAESVSRLSDMESVQIPRQRRDMSSATCELYPGFPIHMNGTRNAIGF